MRGPHFPARRSDPMALSGAFRPESKFLAVMNGKSCGDFVGYCYFMKMTSVKSAPGWGGCRVLQLFLFALFILVPLAECRAAPLGVAEATAQARVWMRGHPVMGAAALREIREAVSFPAATAPYAVHVLQLAPTGYLILNSDDRLPLVVAFSADSALSLDDSPANSFRAFLAQYTQLTADQLSTLPAASPATAAARATATAQSADEVIAPLMDTAWNQCHPYNLYAPADPAGTAYYGYRAPTGCVPTAFGQVLSYHRWPLHGEGSYSYSDASGTIQSAHTADFSDPYDWGAMQPSYDAFGANPATAMAAVAELSYELGVAAGADYENSGTSSSTSVLAAQLARHFYFTDALEQTSQSALLTALVTDLRAGYPVVVTIPGHAVVADGLLTSGGNTTYHINYGWGGTNNGWWTPTSIPNGPFQSGITSLIPKLLAFPMRDPVVVAPGAPCELQWVLPKRRELEANQLNLYQRLPHSQAWTADASSFGRAKVSGWSVVAGGKIGSCWYAGPNGPAWVDVDESLIPTATTFLQFWGRYQIASATFKVWVTDDNGATFTALLSRNYQYPGSWQQESVSLGAYAGKRIRLRLELTSGSYYPGGGVWVDELALTSGTWEGWSPLAQGLALTSQRFSSVNTTWDDANNFSKFTSTSTSTYQDWVINTPETGVTGFYKAPGGYSNAQYHLTSLATITPAANMRLRLRAKYNLATDGFRVLASTSRSANFQVVASYGGTCDWANLAIDLSAFVGQAVFIRLEYVVGSFYSSGGVWIDSVATEQTTHPELEGQPIHFTVPTGIAPGTYQVAGALTNLDGQEQPMSPAFSLQVQAPTTHRVTFLLGSHGQRTGGGALLQDVTHATAATAPLVAPAAGWAFDGWDHPFDSITADLEIAALYHAKLAAGGTPFWWFIDHGLVAAQAPDAAFTIAETSDPFGKGHSLGAQYLFGTDPNDPSSRFDVEAPALSGGKVTLRWTGRQGRSYSVQQTTGLAGGSWLEIARLPCASDGLPMSFTADKPAAARTFYRLGVSLGN
jgi:hypothetical protein